MRRLSQVFQAVDSRDSGGVQRLGLRSPQSCAAHCALSVCAITAFQKQIEINPYDEFAYNNLGRTYWNDRKYDEAVKAFNKQLENNPLDKFAHGNLGAMYAEWHKYDLAVPELEKAASLTPDSAELQVSLGDAYLNLGQDEKALATFDHALRWLRTVARRLPGPLPRKA